MLSAFFPFNEYIPYNLVCISICICIYCMHCMIPAISDTLNRPPNRRIPQIFNFSISVIFYTRSFFRLFLYAPRFNILMFQTPQCGYGDVCATIRERKFWKMLVLTIGKRVKMEQKIKRKSARTKYGF